MTMPNHHILSVLVENKAGVLARVASLFARRGTAQVGCGTKTPSPRRDAR